VPAAETAKCKSILRVEMAQFIGKCKHDALLHQQSAVDRRRPLDRGLQRASVAGGCWLARRCLWQPVARLAAAWRALPGC
jgi:hypothetical protein